MHKYMFEATSVASFNFSTVQRLHNLGVRQCSNLGIDFIVNLKIVKVEFS